ncbi:MAG: hypothetical protein ACHQ5A_00820 [Opitutales bacterium]
MLTTAGLPGFAAVKRVVSITAPASAVAGSTVHITIAASTSGEGDEQIGFLHAQYSTDGGKTWVGICFDAKVGLAVSRQASPAAGKAGSSILIRARAAFRSSAGDVDYSGQSINWDGSWDKWQVPPAKVTRIMIVAR